MRMLLAALVLLAQAAAAFAEPEPAVSSAVIRVAITTRDIEAARRFYVEGLGYSVRYDGDITNPENRTLLGLKGGERARFIVLDSNREFSGKKHDGAAIGLLAVSRRKLGRLVHPRRNDLAAGEAMLAVETSDIAAVILRLRRLGTPILSGPITGHDGHQIEIVVRDPDGTRIHIVEER
jgi:catechol 2,3-dioxygenase-like lactoylglutathione lyase family enzyme